MKPNRPPSHRNGFTLIEMLVVITIILVLTGLSIGGYSFIATKQANEQANLQIHLLSQALEEYKLDNGSYPDSTGGTNELYLKLYYDAANMTPPGKIYLDQLDPNVKGQGWINGKEATATIVDPWGNEYIYRTADDANAKNPDFDLISMGKDGKTNLSNPNAVENNDDIDNF